MIKEGALWTDINAFAASGAGDPRFSFPDTLFINGKGGAGQGTPQAFSALFLINPNLEGACLIC